MSLHETGELGAVRRGPVWFGYLVAITLEVVITAVLHLLRPYVDPLNLPILYVLTIMLVAYVFGLGPAILAFLAGLFAFTYFFVPPTHRLWPISGTEAGQDAWADFLIGTLIVGIATLLMRRSRDQARRLADELDHQKAVLEAFTQNVPVGLSMVDRNMRVMSVNSVFSMMHGVSVDRILGKTLSEIEPSPLASATEHAVLEVFRIGNPIQWREYAAEIEGQRHYANVDYVPVRTHEGEMIGVGIVVTDITVQVTSRQELDHQRALLQTLMENVPIGLGFHDRETHHVIANQMLTEMNQTLAEERGGHIDTLLNKTVWEVLPPELAAAAAGTIEKVFDTGEPSCWPDVVMKVKNEERHYRVQHLPVRTPDQQIIGVGVVVIDTTDQVRTHRELEQSYEHEHRIAETLQTALLSKVPRQIDGFAFETAYRAALEEARVGGDFYDVFRIDENTLGIVIGDVSGKGLRAAVEVAAAKNTIRGRAYESTDPAVVMEKTNNTLLRELSPEDFITVFLGVLDSTSKMLHYANGGHPPRYSGTPPSRKPNRSIPPDLWSAHKPASDTRSALCSYIPAMKSSWRQTGCSRSGWTAAFWEKRAFSAYTKN